jgi:hypothetical protein
MRRLAAAILGAAIAGFLPPGSAHAQSLQSDDPSFLSLGAGGYDVLHENTAGEFRGEFRSSYKLLGLLKPFVGLMGTTDSAFYGYGGVLIDIYFGNRFVLTPNAAFGYYDNGSGKDLGSHAEFRTGAEFAYRFDDRSRLGLAFNHISNAGIAKQNPGAESLVLVYSIPFTLLK